jgi:hypothetical protein
VPVHVKTGFESDPVAILSKTPQSKAAPSLLSNAFVHPAGVFSVVPVDLSHIITTSKSPILSAGMTGVRVVPEAVDERVPILTYVGAAALLLLLPTPARGSLTCADKAEVRPRSARKESALLIKEADQRSC